MASKFIIYNEHWTHSTKTPDIRGRNDRLLSLIGQSSKTLHKLLKSEVSRNSGDGGMKFPSDSSSVVISEPGSYKFEAKHREKISGVPSNGKEGNIREQVI